MKQLRGFRFRFYPTPAQRLELAQTFGCGRFIYNWALSLKIAQAIADCGWGEALRQLQYKCDWHGRTIGAIDRWFPSSKRCNHCGYIKDKLPLDIREWTCPSCESHHQRDIAVRPRAFARR